MKSLEEITASPRVSNPKEHPMFPGGLVIDYQFTTGITVSVIIVPDEGREGGVAMDHVSAAPFKHRHILTWGELVELKRLCFRPDEEAIQVFPKEDEYVHSYGGLENVMHIWGLPKKREPGGSDGRT